MKKKLDEEFRKNFEEDLLLLIAAKPVLENVRLANNKSKPLNLNTNIPLREETDAVWRAIAKGIMADEDTVLWAQWIASHIVKFVIDDPSEPENRPKRALKAIKLSGSGAKHSPEILEEDLMYAFFQLKNAVKKVKGNPQEKLRATQFAKQLKTMGHYPDLTVKVLADQIRMRNKTRDKSS